MTREQAIATLINSRYDRLFRLETLSDDTLMDMAALELSFPVAHMIHRNLNPMSERPEADL